MDFYIDIGFAVLLRLLKDRKSLPKFRTAFLKLAAAIETAFASDATFADDVKRKRLEGV